MALLRAAFFDLDGTLIDREPLMQAAIDRVATERGCVFDEGELGVLIGRAWQDVYVSLQIEQRLKLDYGTFLRDVMGTATTLLSEGFQTRVLDGGVTLIERLHSQGVPVMVVTGSLRTEADAAIAQLGILSLLAGSLAAEDYKVGKPAPDCYLSAAAFLGVDVLNPGEVSRCVVFEDSEPGIASGLAAGMRVIATAAANKGVGDASHQRLDEAHRVVNQLSEVSDDVLSEVVVGG